MTPPLECMTSSGRAWPPSERRPSTEPRYRSITGATAAFSTVVLKRSYSRYSGATDDDVEIGTPGAIPASASRAASSFAGLA